MGKQPGFTLIELIVTVAMIGILFALSLPSFTSMIRNNRATSEANSFLTALMLTRGEAVKRNSPTVMCKTTDGTTCSTSNTATWNQGIIVFVDDGGGTLANRNNHVIDANEALIRTEYPFSSASTITGDTVVRDQVTYGSDGRIQNTFALPSDVAKFTIVPPSTTTAPRKVEINPTGRPRVLVCPPSGAC